MRTQLGKRKRALSAEDGETKTAGESQEDHEVRGKHGGTQDFLVTNSGVSSVGKEGMCNGIVRRIVFSFTVTMSFQVQLSCFGGGGNSGTNAHRSSGGQG